jgi:hypothetical protein
MVTPDGKLRTVSAETEPELFWAVRGAGRGFGVAVSVRLRLFAVGRVVAGTATFEAARFKELLRFYRSWTTELPRHLTTTLTLKCFGASNQLPPPVHNQKTVQVGLVGIEPATPLTRRAIDDLLALGPIRSDIADMPYADAASVFREPDAPHPYEGDAVVVDDLEPDGADSVSELNDIPGDFAFLAVHQLGGALSTSPAPGNAVGHRSASFLVRTVRDPRHRSDSDSIALIGNRPRGRMLNFLFGHPTPRQVRDCYEPTDYLRLRELKSAVDPDNLLRFGRAVTFTDDVASR